MTKATRIAIALGLSGSAALAHGGVKDENVLARMNGMSDLKAEMQIIGQMAKGARSFDSARVEAALSRMSDAAAEMPALFEPRAMDPKSEARPVIWDEFDTFTMLAEDLRTVSADLAGAGLSESDLPQAVRMIGKACSACHEDYRE